MKFHVAWDSIEKENRTLKMAGLALLLCTMLLSIALIRTSIQPPLLVERGCRTRPMTPSPDISTDDELKAFTEEAIQARFNTSLNRPEFLSAQEQGFRVAEQGELSKQKMKQTVIVNSAEITKDGILVDADRLISVDQIRSTFKFPLKIEFERESRSESNPYGLILSHVESLKEEVKK